MQLASPPVAQAAISKRGVPDAWMRPLPVALIGALGGASIVRYGLGLHAVVAALCAGVLVALAAIDIRCHVLPNRIVLPAAALVLAAEVAISPSAAPRHLLYGVAAALFMALPLAFNPNGMGLGDVKLTLLLGFWLGANVLPALVLAFLAVLPVSLYLLVRHGRAVRGRAIAFGPFLAFGALAVSLLGGA